MPSHVREQASDCLLRCAGADRSCDSFAPFAARSLQLACLVCPQVSDAEVRREDQLRINEFGRSNLRLHLLRDEIKDFVVRSFLTSQKPRHPFPNAHRGRRSRLIVNVAHHTTRSSSSSSSSLPCSPLRSQTQIENLGDACDEIALNDEEGAVKLMVGECWVDIDGDAAEEEVEKIKAKLEETLASHEREQQVILKRQSELKEALYGRFGKSINLEE